MEVCTPRTEVPPRELDGLCYSRPVSYRRTEESNDDQAQGCKTQPLNNPVVRYWNRLFGVK